MASINSDDLSFNEEKQEQQIQGFVGLHLKLGPKVRAMNAIVAGAFATGPWGAGAAAAITASTAGVVGWVVSTSGDPTYSKDNFQYQKETDTYRCPQGKELPYKENTSKNGMKYKRYKGGDICLSCPVYNLCTKAKTGRNIQRWEHEELLEKLKEDTEANNETYKKRSQIVEHPFGTIK